MSDKVVIDGDVTLTSTIDGEGGVYFRLGQNPVIQSLDVTENGVYSVPEGVDGYSPVTVDVPLPLPVIEPLDATENGVYSVPDGVDGYSPVTVALPEYEGAYAVEPSTEEQTLATAGKVMAGDVTVGKVEPVFWKSVTLEEDHTQVGIGNPVYWFDFFGIPREDIQNGWVYDVHVENNQSENYYVRYIRYFLTPVVGSTDNGVYVIYVRGGNVGTNNKNNYYLFAVNGTVFNIYRYRAI